MRHYPHKSPSYTGGLLPGQSLIPACAGLIMIYSDCVVAGAVYGNGRSTSCLPLSFRKQELSTIHAGSGDPCDYKACTAGPPF